MKKKKKVIPDLTVNVRNLSIGRCGLTILNKFVLFIINRLLLIAVMT